MTWRATSVTQCDKRYKNKGDMRLHILKVREGKGMTWRAASATQCDKRYMNKGDMRLHILKVMRGRGVSDLACYQCDPV